MFRLVVRRLAVALTLILPGLVRAAAEVAPAPADVSVTWRAADRAVAERLLQPEAKLPELALAAAAASPATGRAALERLSLLLRAGLLADAEQAIAALPARCPDYYAAQLEVLLGQLRQPPYVAEAAAGRLEAAYRSALATPPRERAQVVMNPGDMLVSPEPGGEEDPRFWLKRAAELEAQAHFESADAAFRRALALAPPAPPEKGRDARGEVLLAYAKFLQRHGPADSAMLLWRGELTLAPGSASANLAANRLVLDFPDGVRATAEPYWQWLAARPDWSGLEGQVLAKLLENTATDSLRRETAERARGLALDPAAAPARAYELAKVFARQNEPGRAVPLLQESRQRSADAALRARAAVALVEALNELRDWRAAEALLPEAAPALEPSSLPDWLARLALTAARNDAPPQALRLWQRAANVNLNYTDNLGELATYGLHNDLRAYYARLGQELSASTAPAKALAVLNAKPGGQ